MFSCRSINPACHGFRSRSLLLRASVAAAVATLPVGETGGSKRKGRSPLETAAVRPLPKKASGKAARIHAMRGADCIAPAGSAERALVPIRHRYFRGAAGLVWEPDHARVKTSPTSSTGTARWNCKPVTMAATAPMSPESPADLRIPLGGALRCPWSIILCIVYN